MLAKLIELSHARNQDISSPEKEVMERMIEDDYS